MINHFFNNNKTCVKKKTENNDCVYNFEDKKLAVNEED